MTTGLTEMGVICVLYLPGMRRSGGVDEGDQFPFVARTHAAMVCQGLLHIFLLGDDCLEEGLVQEQADVLQGS